MAKKKKDNLRRGKRGPVPRFDYHITFSRGEEGTIKYVNNVKDVLFQGWERHFRLDSHLLNKSILKDGEAVFKRRDGARMTIRRTMKFTPEEMVDMYMSGEEDLLDRVDYYLAVNPGLRRKVSPMLKEKSKASMRLRPAKDPEEAKEALNQMPVSGMDAPEEEAS